MAARKSMWSLFTILVISAWVLGSASPTHAEDLKCRLVSIVTKVDTHKVDDQEGHIVGTAERKGLMLHDNGDVANELNKVIFDSVAGVSKWQGYCLQTFKEQNLFSQHLCGESGERSTRDQGECEHEGPIYAIQNPKGILKQASCFPLKRNSECKTEDN